MTAPSQSEVVSRVRAYLAENFLYMRPDLQLDDDDRLLERGVIDSMGVMEVVSFLEDAFGVVVGEDDLTEDNLGTVNAIAAFVVRHASEGGPSAKSA